MNQKNRFRAWLFIPLLLFLIPVVAEAGKFKVGDVVQVYDDWKKEWKNGTVVDVNRRGELLIETASYGNLRRDVYQPKVVRFAYEDGAIGPARTWTDTSGTFKIMAAPLGIVEDKIRLRREDMSEIEVPIAKLGDADQRYIDRMKAEMGIRAVPSPDPIPPIRFAGTDNENLNAFGSVGYAEERIAILPDPLPSYMVIPQGGVGFGKHYEEEQFGLIQPIGGPDGLVLVSAEYPVDPRKADEFDRTRIAWISLKEKKISKEQALPDGEMVLDYHPASHRLLTYRYKRISGSFGRRKSILSIWEVLPTDESMTPIVSWEAYPEDGYDKEPWARLINGNLVLHRFADKQYVGWDIANKSVAYRIFQDNMWSTPPTLSGTSKYGFLVENKSVRIFDAVTGTTITKLITENPVKLATPSEDGSKLATLEENTLTIWNLTDPAAEPVTHPAESIGGSMAKEMYWVNSDMLMIKNFMEMILYDLNEGIAIWNYHLEHGTVTAVKESEGRQTMGVLNGHLVYGAELQANGRRAGLAVGNVKLPGPDVREKVEGVSREDLVVVKPGSKIRLEVRCGDQHNPAVYNALVAKIRENGWELNQEDYDAIMHAEITRGEPVTRTYRFFGFSRAPETVTYTPIISKLDMTIGDATIWLNQTSTGPGMFVGADETIQQQVDRQTEDVNFFTRSRLPAMILDPKYGRGFGSTKVSTKGLEPSTMQKMIYSNGRPVYLKD
ncbi:SHD1 domain-containing protein [Bremerella volcania]|nr:SHD1 domain-containing protein [Bremerella volcania]